MRTRTWKMGAFAGVAVLVLGLGACGDDDDDATDTGTDAGTETTEGADTTEAAGEGASVVMANFAFDPTELTVGPGEAITVTNEDSAGHTFTIDDEDIDVDLGGGESGEATAPSEPGDYEFRCRFHSNMTGTLTVE